MISFQPCANPECEYPANPDPSVSVGFCCEKCEGRFNGEEWATGGKKKHTAYCTSRDESLSGSMAEQSYGPVKKHPRKCANPDCSYMKHSDPSISQNYCCEKCEGVHQGAEWAEGGKKHYKHCEKIEAVGGGGAASWGSQGAQSWGAPNWDEGDEWTWLASAIQQFAAAKGGWGGAGKAAGKGKFQGKSKGPGLRDYEADHKIWVGGLAEGTTAEVLTEHFQLAGGAVKFAAMMANGTTGGVAFESAEEATNAINLFNGTEINGAVVQVDVWTGK